MRGISVVLVLICVCVLSACGDSEETSSPQTVTVVERTVTAEARAEEPVAETPPADVSERSSQEGSIAKVRVPDVVGKDHQLAQDTMQAAGLYDLAEEDASGQGRALLFDRNWTVVSQSPKAGTQASEDQTITLRAIKDGE